LRDPTLIPRHPTVIRHDPTVIRRDPTLVPGVGVVWCCGAGRLTSPAATS
jgi:hypothetical protein